MEHMVVGGVGIDDEASCFIVILAGQTELNSPISSRHVANDRRATNQKYSKDSRIQGTQWRRKKRSVLSTFIITFMVAPKPEKGKKTVDIS